MGQAFGRVAAAARAAGKPLAAFGNGAEAVARLARDGVGIVIAGSDQGLLLHAAGALRAAAEAVTGESGR